MTQNCPYSNEDNKVNMIVLAVFDMQAQAFHRPMFVQSRGVGVREHVKRLRWKTHYDESAKLFDENLQNS